MPKPEQLSRVPPWQAVGGKTSTHGNLGDNLDTLLMRGVGHREYEISGDISRGAIRTVYWDM
jgi:hypothetical protein